MVDGGTEALETFLEHSRTFLPTVPRLVRLTFHDCLKYVSGGGGCDGCLNFKNMGTYINEPMTIAERSMTDNNNLVWVAQVLEGIYKNPTFGSYKLKHFDTSLFERGMSRADLWAFAGIVAVQAGIENNNEYCQNLQNNHDEDSCYVYDRKDCSINENIESIFKTGRSDCVSTDSEVACDAPNDQYAFCTKKNEIHPNPHQNGTTTAEFFNDHFNLTAKEAVTLMGAHTFGSPKTKTSGFRRYGWTAQGQQAFNSQYFKNIVKSRGYKLAQRGQGGGYGDAFGNPINFSWHIRRENKSPKSHQWNWSLQGDKCNDFDCGLKKGEERPNYYKDYDGPCNSCCRMNKQGRLLEFRSVQMLTADMGLHRKFFMDTETLKPQGCPGFTNSCKKYSEPEEGCFLPGATDATGCERNDEPAAEGQTMADVVEEYAEDQDAFAKDFVAVYDKMLANGYDYPLTSVKEN